MNRYRLLLPQFVAMLPPLVLLVRSLNEVPSLSALPTLLISAAAGLALGILFYVLIRRSDVAAVSAALLITAWQAHHWLGFASLFVAAAGVYLLYRPWNEQLRFPRLLIDVNLVPLSILTTLILGYAVARNFVMFEQPRPQAAAQYRQAGPDVYFIILDSYTGAQVLQERFGFDNSPFLEALRSLGFQAGDCYSPFRYTGPSLASTLNGGLAIPEEINAPLYMDLIRHSLTRRTLEARGYDTVAFSTGFHWDEIQDAAFYYAPPSSVPGQFATFFLQTTPAQYLFSMENGEPFRAATRTLLAHLADPARNKYSQFVMAHIIQPHPPFVFNSDGSARRDSELANPRYGRSEAQEMYGDVEYAQGYLDQVRYINAALLPELRRIVAAAPDTQIILTGDHGAWYYKDPTQAYSVTCATLNLSALEAGQAINEIINPPAE